MIAILQYIEYLLKSLILYLKKTCESYILKY